MAEEMSPEQALAMQKQNCVFCKIIKGEIPSKKVHEDKECVAILDINPANEGHVLLLPKEHYAIMPQVPENILAHLAIIAKKISKAELLSTYGKSTSIFVANGAAAGQKAPHFMIHIIPRKVANEFFEIPQNSANPSELEAVKNVVASKMQNLTGKRFVEEKKEIPRQEPADIPKPEVKVEPPKAEKIREEPLNHPRKIAKLGVKREKGYLYYIDEDGDVARAPMKRGGKKKEDNVDEEKEDDENKKDNTSPSLDDISRLLLGGSR